MVELEKKIIENGKTLDGIKNISENKFEKYMELVKELHNKENKKERE
ncbi:hypothetical protein [Clostridioides sp. ZZV15-6598]|nr:hypothetical protein [Clostridioides sp. ZZV15-6598]